ncbi:hypothetical protein BBJ28_00011473 [Nothophytophthora sp. Chile5]|nr:hypothetical protein BBJ28_00011473 [Nothophytophthora sp. Chile5]
MDGQWRQEIPEDMRKKMITEMYHELSRISGESDKQKVWGSAAKFELMLWSSSPDRRKIMSLKKKPGAGDLQQQQQANLMANGNNTSAPTVATTQAAALAAAAAQRGVKPEQLATAHSQQAAMREMQRAQNAAQMHADSALKHQTPNGSMASAAPTTTVTAATTATTTTGTDNGNQSYVERLKEMKQKYWDDLVIVYREFERMVKQKPANQQQERINTFLVNLKRIIALLQQDPSKVTSNNKNDLDRVEAHIHKQEMLEQQRKQKQKQLQAQHAQQQALLQQQQQQRQQMLVQQQQAQLKAQNQLRMNAAAQQQKAAVSGAMGIAGSALLAAGNGSAAANANLPTAGTPTNLGASRQNPIEIATSSPGGGGAANGIASLTPAQYRTFKLAEPHKQRLTAQHAQLREQQQELIMQQGLAKTPGHQAKLAHQAQRIAQMINKISQQLVQCKLAEEYEQAKNISVSTTLAQPTLSQSTATSMALNKVNALNMKPELASVSTPTSNGAALLAATSAAAVSAGQASVLLAAQAAASNAMKVDTAAASAAAAAMTAVPTSTVSEPLVVKLDENFKSVVPDLTGLGASEKLLTAVAAYEKHKPEVLKRGASRFSRIAVTIGAKLNTSYVTS